MSLDINLTNIQSIPIVVNANITAENNKVYHVVANATFTDPTPVEGRGYVVFVRNGTATIGGNQFSTSGNFIYRLFHSGAWALYPFGNINSLATIFNAAYVPQSRTINGLDLSANRTLTTANINDSTNKRYVTDAQLTVLGNTSGTNTGDQNLSGLVPYTGATADVDLDTFGLDAKFIKIKGTGGNGHLNLKHQSSGATAGGSESVLYADNSGNPKWKNDGNAVQDVLLSGTTTADIADSSNKRYVTDAQLTVLNNASFNRKIVGSTNANTTTETILATFTITANTLSANDVLKIMASTIKTNTNGSYTLRIRHNTSNTLVGATQIALLSVSTLANVNANFSRQNFIITGGNLTGFSFTTSVLSDINSQFSGALSSIAFDVAIENYIFITVQLSSASDLCSLRFANIQNF